LSGSAISSRVSAACSDRVADTSPFAGVLPRGDAVDPASLLPRSGPATRPQADPLGLGALSFPCDPRLMRALVDAGNQDVDLGVMFNRSASSIRKFRSRHGIEIKPVPRFCEYCPAEIPYHTRLGPANYMRAKCCGASKCLDLKRKGYEQKYRPAIDDKRPHTTERAADRSKADAALFAGLSFSDDPRAIKGEPRFMKLPEPVASGCGNSSDMCAV
jgi:hypothetical protein